MKRVRIGRCIGVGVSSCLRACRDLPSPLGPAGNRDREAAGDRQERGGDESPLLVRVVDEPRVGDSPLTPLRAVAFERLQNGVLDLAASGATGTRAAYSPATRGRAEPSGPAQGRERRCATSGGEVAAIATQAKLSGHNQPNVRSHPNRTY